MARIAVIIACAVVAKSSFGACLELKANPKDRIEKSQVLQYIA